MKRSDLLLGLFVTVLWGANFSAIKLGLATVDPFLLTALRFLFCALPAIWLLPRPALPLWVPASYGMLFGLGLWGAVNFAIHIGLSAGLASLVLQSSAIFTVLLAARLFGERVAPAQWFGIALATGGLLAIIASTQGRLSLAGTLLVVFAALCWSICMLLVRRHRPEHMLAFVVWSGAFAVVPLFALTWLVKGAAPFVALVHDANAGTVFSVAYQAYVVTLFGYAAWNRLVGRYPASTVAPLSLMVPVTGLLVAWLAYGEEIGGGKLAGALVVLAGLAVFSLARRWPSRWLPAVRREA